MTEIILHTPGYRSNYSWIADVPDAGVLISAAVSGYLAGRIPSSVLLAVLKLHSCADPEKWVKVTRGQRKILSQLASRLDILKPIYSWQGEAAVGDEEWANCLGPRDTHRFMAFIGRAWQENWPLLEPTDAPEEWDELLRKDSHFRDYQVSRDLHKATNKIGRFKRPSVFRRWS